MGTGRVELSVAGNLRVLLANPTGSGVIATIVGLAGLSTVTGWPEVIIDPTAGLPATAVRPVLRLNPVGGTTASLQLTADTSATTALGGGTNTGVVLGTPANQRFVISPLGLIIPPGSTRGINTAFTGAATVALAVYVVEELI
jgi:hypothetical protein